MLKNWYICRARRCALGMTQIDLAKKIGRTGAWVSLYERGKITDQGMTPVIFRELAKMSENLSPEETTRLCIKTNIILIDIYKKYDREVPEELWSLFTVRCAAYARRDF